MTIPRTILEGGLPKYAPPDSDAYRPTGGAGPVERLFVAKPSLPCPGCLHRPVCIIAPLLAPESFAIRTPASPHAAIRVSLTVAIECAHYLADPAPAAAPEPVSVPPTASAAAHIAASRQRGAAGLTKARAVLAERHEAGGGPGDAPAATTRKTKSPETRERMRQAQIALAERRRAARESTEVPA